jgi:hypothetical protein
MERLGRLFGTTGRLLFKELSGFGVVGAVCFFIDLGVFQLLYAHVGAGAVTSKFVSTVVSMTAAYYGTGPSRTGRARVSGTSTCCSL